MNEEIIEIALTELFMRTGPLGIILFCLSVSILAVGVSVFLFSKNRKEFGVWLITNSIYFSIISACTYLLYELVEALFVLQSTGILYEADRILFDVLESCIGPSIIMSVALFAFVIRFVIQCKDKFANQRVDLTR